MQKHRKLAAIMFTDIVGYTALMSKNEENALCILQKHRDILKPLISEFSGEWLKEMGDGMLSSFGSVVDAVNCALKIQNSLRNEPDFKLRIGIHIGDVVVEGGDVFGDGVNVASRIENIAEPGGICISGQVHDNIRNKPDIKTVLIGEKTLKNVDYPIKIYALYGERLPASTKSIPVEQDSTTKSKPSIAVLPFDDMSAEKNQEYFCDGMAEEIINALTHIEGLRVIARTSAFYFKGKVVKIRDIGRELNVETVLEGSVRKAGNRIRITAQLVTSEDGYHLWSEKYDREMEDIFEIQDEISLAIVEALKVKLLKKEKAAIEKRHTVNIEAYDLYLRVKYIFDMLSFERLPQKDQDELAQARAKGEDYLKIIYQKCFDYLNQALLIDPHFALPHVMRANIYMLIAWTGYLSPKEGWTKAREEAVKALQIDYSLAEAHVALAIISLFHDWDWPAVERGLKQAFELNQNVFYANTTYSDYLVTRGEYNKALTYAKQALAIDPLNVESYCQVMTDLYCMGSYDEVIEHFYKAIDINPNNQLAYRVMGHLYLRQNRYKNALEAFEKIREILGEMIVTDEWIAYTYTRLGEKEKAEQILKKWLHQSREEYVPSMSLASMYIGLGDYYNAFKRLDIACDEHDSHLVFLTFWPDFDPIRSDPRYKALLKKMGLPE